MKSRTLLFSLLLSLFVAGNYANAQSAKDRLAMQHLLNLFEPDTAGHQAAFDFLNFAWQDEYTVMALEVLNLQRDPDIARPLLALLDAKTGENFGYRFNLWYSWLWKKDQKVPETYADFKAALYSLIDPKFETYFLGRYESDIRMDEVHWGGVVQDGIPPLRQPAMIAATEADYLADEHVVFGIEVNGDVRAYPKRILAWHEMFVDEVGGIKVTGVYCTLCGTVILYNSTFDGLEHEMGTSGFLYRSNKLMYDKRTQSLWNTLWGTPVLGPLKGRGIELEKLSVVTTTWGEWKRRHPETKVLSLETGHQRDYGEGVAYADYFATDRLMFNTPFNDKRLKNKQEVLALTFPEYPREQLAISADFLVEKPIYQSKLGPVSFVVFTDQSGGNRVYKTEEGIRFNKYDGKETIKDKSGATWTLYENRLERADGKKLERLPYHRAFWFGWQAAYPNTKLIK